MIGPTTDNDWQDPDEPSMERLLGYRSQLHGSVFVEQVLGTIAQRYRRRRLVLAGAALLAPLVALVVRPQEFSFPTQLRLPLQGLGDAVASLPVGGLMGIVLFCVLLIGVAKTVDSI